MYLLGLTALAERVIGILVVTGASTGHDWRLFCWCEVVREVAVIEASCGDGGKEEKEEDEE